MSLWVHTDNDTEKERRLTAAWETFKRSQPVAKSGSTQTRKQMTTRDANDDNETPLPAIVETLNTR